MSIDLINNLLEKLKEKTGREWGLADLMQLAQRLPELNGNNIDVLLDELNSMGLELPENTKEKVLKKLEENPDLSFTDIQQVRRRIKEEKSPSKKEKSTSNRKKSSSGSSKKKPSLLDRVKQMQSKSKKRKKK